MISQLLPLDGLQTTFDLAKHNALQHLYSVAIELLDQIVFEVQHTLLSILLVHRAAAHRHAGNLVKALQDAQRAMKQSPEIPDGYVQAAAVFLSQGKDGKALITYEKLLKSVPKDHPYYNTFLARKNLLEQQVGKRNNHFLQRFPYHILNRIFSFLSLRDRVSCASTCRSWRRFFNDWSPMFRVLDLDNDYYLVSLCWTLQRSEIICE